MRKDEKKNSGRHWPWIVVGLLVANAAGVVILLLVSTTDASHHVESDYYRKGLNFNQTIAQRKKNLELGWQLGIRVGAAEKKSRRLQFKITDAEGRAIRGADIELLTFHKARASRRLKAKPLELASLPGYYQTRLPMFKEGIWEFRVVVNRGGQRFTARKDIDTSSSDAPVEPPK